MMGGGINHLESLGSTIEALTFFLSPSFFELLEKEII